MVVIRTSYTKRSWNGGQINEPLTLYYYKTFIFCTHLLVQQPRNGGQLIRNIFTVQKVFNNLKSSVTKSIVRYLPLHYVTHFALTIVTYQEVVNISDPIDCDHAHRLHHQGSVTNPLD